MKKKALANLLILLSLNCFSQQSKSKIPLIITIDGQIITEGLFHGFFFIVDTTDRNIDTVKFVYQVGQASMTQKEYDKLHSLKSAERIQVKFVYNPFKSTTRTPHVYTHFLSKGAMNDVYLILNVFNYANKINYSFFSKRRGYGIEEKFPGGGTKLLSRIKRPPIPW